MMRKPSALLRDESGASIIEMGLMMPVLATLLIGMVDLSRGYSAKLQLEQAAQRSIERAMNGEKDTDLFESLEDEAVAAAGVSASAVEIRFWLECDGVSQNTSPSTMVADYENSVCDDGEPQARYVNVRIEKVFTPMFGTRFAGAQSDGTYLLEGEAGIRVQ
jgi:Flp pilus assembly protein TadG